MCRFRDASDELMQENRSLPGTPLPGSFWLFFKIAGELPHGSAEEPCWRARSGLIPLELSHNRICPLTSLLPWKASSVGLRGLENLPFGVLISWWRCTAGWLLTPARFMIILNLFSWGKKYYFFSTTNTWLFWGWKVSSQHTEVFFSSWCHPLMLPNLPLRRSVVGLAAPQSKHMAP